MCKSLQIFFFSLLLTQICFAQWEWQNPLPQGNHLRKIHYSDVDHGSAVGDAGIIVRTTNAGLGWKVQESGTKLLLLDVFFTDLNNGYAVGGTGALGIGKDTSIILKTTDGGENWIRLPIYIKQTLCSVFFIDVNNGYAVGWWDSLANSKSVILCTKDAGTTWSIQHSGTTPLSDIFFIDSNLGWAVGRDGEFNGKVLKTTDGGNNWNIQNPISAPVEAVYFINANKGWAVGSRSGNGGFISRTTDGGISWVSAPLGGPAVASDFNSSDIFFIDENVGVLVCEGTIFRSTNGGISWTRVFEPWAQGWFITSFCFADLLTGWAVGNAGTMYKTTDVATTWQQVSSSYASCSLRGIDFPDNQNGWVVGGDSRQEWSTGPFILHTTNAGLTWNRQLCPASDQWLADVEFIDADNGWAVGHATIIHTTDGGNSWTTQTHGTSIYLMAVCFADPNTGWVVGEGTTILKTTDGGSHWVEQISTYTNWFSDVCFTDTLNGTIVGWGGPILHTTDGGINWTPQTSGTTEWLNGVHFIDKNNGYAVGDNGTIIKTTNAGLNWTLLTSGTTMGLSRVHFTDINNGWVVGWHGLILKTTNGGTDWLVQNSYTNHKLNDIFFTDVQTGWAVGDNGTILHTTNGGNPVPVELNSFTAKANGKEVTLNWLTATELNNQGFEVQRKFSDNNFVTIGSVKGHGTTTSPNNYTYMDKLLTSGKYFYRLKQIDYDGKYEYSQTVEVNWSPFTSYKLEQNYPNPFNPITTIGFGIPEKGNVRLSILNILGEEIKVLLNEEKVAAYHSIDFNASDLPSGVYFYQLKAGSFIETKKMILLR